MGSSDFAKSFDVVRARTRAGKFDEALSLLSYASDQIEEDRTLSMYDRAVLKQRVQYLREIAEYSRDTP